MKRYVISRSNTRIGRMIRKADILAYQKYAKESPTINAEISYKIAKQGVINEIDRILKNFGQRTTASQKQIRRAYNVYKKSAQRIGLVNSQKERIVKDLKRQYTPNELKDMKMGKIVRGDIEIKEYGNGNYGFTYRGHDFEGQYVKDGKGSPTFKFVRIN